MVEPGGEISHRRGCWWYGDVSLIACRSERRQTSREDGFIVFLLMGTKSRGTNHGAQPGIKLPPLIQTRIFNLKS
jgi:hypothetical protein